MNSETPRRPEAGPAAEIRGPLPGAGALPELAVSVRGLTKTYKATGKSKAKTALKAVELDIPRGCLFGLLGPNDDGQSTLINILAVLVIHTDQNNHRNVKRGDRLRIFRVPR